MYVFMCVCIASSKPDTLDTDQLRSLAAGHVTGTRGRDSGGSRVLGGGGGGGAVPPKQTRGDDHPALNDEEPSFSQVFQPSHQLGEEVGEGVGEGGSG